MRFQFASLGPITAISLALGACTNASEPAGPLEPVQPAAGARQDQLAAWFARSSPVVLGLPATVFADHDEAGNRLVFGVEHTAAIRGVINALAGLGIPSSAYVIQITPAIHQLTTLRDRWRPTLGGIQVRFRQFLCTLGFNADAGAQRSFITNSHCTARPGGVENTIYFQPTRNVDPTVMATEVDDPPYFRWGACPRGRRCRYSDAARALYSPGVASTRGEIAKTSGPNNGSLDAIGTFIVSSQDNTTTSFTEGALLNKVGRTTGWTQGTVRSSCANVNVFGSNFTQLCQTLVEHPSEALLGGGDSGAGVFRILSGDDVELVGILWGGSRDGRWFVFSPLKNIQDELGPLTATQ